MDRSYRRFIELKEKAVQKLNSKYGLPEQRLSGAVGELNMLRQNEVPEHKWAEVEAIIKSCKVYPALADEGIFNATISKMTNKEKENLEAAIRYL